MKVFIDTDILVYAHDQDAGVKHAKAVWILKDCWRARNGSIGTQVLQEFYVNVTRRISQPVSRDAARQVVEVYRVWDMAVIETEDILAASRIEERHRLSFWDALRTRA